MPFFTIAIEAIREINLEYEFEVGDNRSLSQSELFLNLEQWLHSDN
jgi:hypothetical protein